MRFGYHPDLRTVRRVLAEEQALEALFGSYKDSPLEPLTRRFFDEVWEAEDLEVLRNAYIRTHPEQFTSR